MIFQQICQIFRVAAPSSHFDVSFIRILVTVNSVHLCRLSNSHVRDMTPGVD